MTNIRCVMEVSQGNLHSPVTNLGSRKERKGRPETRHLPHLVCVVHGEHGRPQEGCEGRWKEEGESRMKCRCLHGESDGA